MPTKPLIKVCGLTRPTDATIAAILGADLCGFIFHPASPRAVTPAKARTMSTPGALRVGVFVDQSVCEIMAVMEEVCLDLAQLHGDQNPDVAVTLGPERVIKVFWPEAQPNDELLRLMDLWKDLATYFLFDAGSSGGGHGRGINTSLPVSPKPYFLAGRIDPAKARGLWPSDDPMLAGFDLNSGLEKSPGVKDHVVLKSFLPWR